MNSTNDFGSNLTRQVNNMSKMFLLDSHSNVFEKDLKVDRRILDLMKSGGNDVFPSLRELLSRIISETGSNVDTSNSFKDRQGNEIPILKVQSASSKNLDAASALIMEYLDPHRDKMTFNIDVPYNDHSYIIGKDGSRIKQLSLDTGCHIHLPDCNKTSGKKSNKLSIAGTSFESIEKARNQIRKSLPLNVGFKARVKSRKFVHIDTSSSEVQSIKRKFKVDVTFTNVISNNKYTEVTINVKGGRGQLEDINSATQDLYRFVTGEEIDSNQVEFVITIDISNPHHLYVKGKNNCNLRVIHQRTKAIVSFPNENESTNQVFIQGKDLISTVLGWQELMGYLPLLLSFDVNFNINNYLADVQRLEKEFGVGIRLREKLSGHVYTVLIKTQERHSISLQEIRQKILELKTKIYSRAYNNIVYSASHSIYGNVNHSMVRSMLMGGNGMYGSPHPHLHHGKQMKNKSYDYGYNSHYSNNSLRRMKGYCPSPFDVLSRGSAKSLPSINLNSRDSICSENKLFNYSDAHIDSSCFPLSDDWSCQAEVYPTQIKRMSHDSHRPTTTSPSYFRNRLSSFSSSHKYSFEQDTISKVFANQFDKEPIHSSPEGDVNDSDSGDECDLRSSL